MGIPNDVSYIIEKLNGNGYEAFIVGGSVRDMILKKEPKDWDLTTNAKPENVIEIFPKVIETGIQHGTVTVIINKENYEVTTYRIDGEYGDNRRPNEVFFTDNLKEDLLRRDFTINAIAYHPKTGFFDPFNGQKDIEEKTIKAVGDPNKRFGEDALRIMRAIRFSTQLGFSIEENTFKSIIENANLLQNISVERIRDELYKTFSSKYVVRAMEINKTSIIKYALPIAKDYFEDNLKDIVEILDIFVNENEVVNSSEIWAVVFSKMHLEDLGRALNYLKLDNKTAKNTYTLVKHLYKDIKEDRYEIKKDISEIGIDLFYDLLKIKKALGKNIERTENIAKDIVLQKEPLVIKDLEINGNDLIEGFKVKGKEIGEILNMLLEKVLLEPKLNTKESLYSLVKELYKLY